MLLLQNLAASKMFNILLFLLGFVTVETSRKHLLCNTSKVEIFYEMCDDSLAPVVKLEPCELTRNKAVNFSMTMIPRKNIDRLYSTVQIWKESVTVSQRRYVMCSEENDEYDFCGTLKGETLNAYYHDDRSFRKLQLLKGQYTVRISLYVGEKEELLSCFLMTLKVKVAFL